MRRVRREGLGVTFEPAPAFYTRCHVWLRCRALPRQASCPGLPEADRAAEAVPVWAVEGPGWAEPAAPPILTVSPLCPGCPGSPSLPGGPWERTKGGSFIRF